MLEGLRSEDLVQLLAKVKDDGSGLSDEEARRFLDIVDDDELPKIVKPHVSSRAMAVARMVRRRHPHEPAF
jgi:hypothetical protein